MKMPIRALFGRSIVGNLGSIIGTVEDIIIDEETGKVISLSVEPSPQSPIPPNDENYTLIPFKIVNAIKDVVVIDESKITKKV
ncbi:PRC-barrel domain-containing protein [Methanotorris igneus]|uniref:PRC-barrel domain protein n=1 Tax=Methanotorris igneus (strain DSM 5666 / JCM 11834 / Kol 5) TaxID=880724 RepID=F6BEI5_METIK|nr:PRC-barrel domain-containing protein [Methanotorris igneus]AEF95646.1 PRC-barrel domain protein [Methanotorris igneus Kol 5]